MKITDLDLLEQEGADRKIALCPSCNAMVRYAGTRLEELRCAALSVCLVLPAHSPLCMLSYRRMARLTDPAVNQGQLPPKPHENRRLLPECMLYLTIRGLCYTLTYLPTQVYCRPKYGGLRSTLEL